MIAWFVRNPVAANLLMLSIILAGFSSLKLFIPLEVFPAFELDRISINVALRGATPKNVEQSVTVRIEEALQNLEGVKDITSRTVEGSCSVIVEVARGYNKHQMLADIKSQVDTINTFPADIERPIIQLQKFQRNVITIVLSSKHSEQEINEYLEEIREEVVRLPNVSLVELKGVRNFEISISISQDILRAHGLSLPDVANAIASSNLDISSGNLKTKGGDLLIRSNGLAYRTDAFTNIPIKTHSDGTELMLAEIANINDGFEETPVRTRFNGQPAALIDVFRIGEESAIEVANQVKTYVEQKKTTLPNGFQLNVWGDNSIVVKNRIATLNRNAIQGGILVLLLLALFLRPAIAFWVFLGIPVCFLGAFIVMPWFGATLNVVSLFGFILVLGIVVDDAIVTGENIYTHLRHAQTGEQAAIIGTQEVTIPVTFGILTTVAAFFPLMFIEGDRGKIFAQIPYVVIPVLLFSLIESKLVLPSHLKNIKLRKNIKSSNSLERFQQNFADNFEKGVLYFYQPLLRSALKNRFTTLAIFISAFLIILSLILSGWMKFVFFPRIPSETVKLELRMPSGTPFTITDQAIAHITKQAIALKEQHFDETLNHSLITDILAISGGAQGADNQGNVRFEIIPPELRSRPISSQTLVKEWRQKIGEIAGAESLSIQAEIGRASDPIDIQLRGSSITSLENAAELVKAYLATLPTIFDIRDNLADGKQTLDIELTPLGKILGLTRREVAQQVRNAIWGIEVQRLQRGRNDVRVMLRLPANERDAINSLERLEIQTTQGQSIRLTSVARISNGLSPAAIDRINQFRTLNIRADVDKNNTNMTVLQAEVKQFLTELMEEHSGITASMEGEAKEQRESFESLKWGLLFTLFVIYCLLAIPFKSYRQPLVVMSVIPFGLIGSALGHLIMGMDLTIFSLMGMLALVGVVVNDSLVLVDFINQRYQATQQLMASLLTAGTARFRPVMLTSITTFIGLMPLLFEKSTQAQFLIPMAVSLGFGIIFATIITLILVPVSYSFIGTANIGTASIGTASIDTANIGTASLGTASLDTAKIDTPKNTDISKITPNASKNSPNENE